MHSAADLPASAFAAANAWRDGHEPGDAPALSDPVDLELRLLRQPAEEPFISGRLRARARRYFRDLEKARAGPLLPS